MGVAWDKGMEVEPRLVSDLRGVEVGPRRCGGEMTESRPHRRNRAHDPTSDGCQLRPKKRGVGSVWDTHVAFADLSF